MQMYAKSINQTSWNTAIEVEYKGHQFTILGDVRMEKEYEDAWSYSSGNHTSSYIGTFPEVQEATATSNTAPADLLGEVVELAQSGQWGEELCEEHKNQWED